MIYWAYRSADTTLYLSNSALQGDYNGTIDEVEVDEIPWGMLENEIEYVDILSHIQPVNINFYFANLYNLKNIYHLQNLDLTRCTNMQLAFANCHNLRSIDLSNSGSINNITNMIGVFSSCLLLEEIFLPEIDTSQVTSGLMMFADDQSLTTIHSPNNWTFSPSCDTYAMFQNCVSLEGAVRYDRTKTDGTMANYDTGYFTKLETLNITTHIYPDSSYGTVEVSHIGNTYTFNAIPNRQQHRKFLCYICYNSPLIEYTENPLTLEFTEDSDVYVVFTSDDYYRVNINSSVKGSTPYKSCMEFAWEGDSIEIRAREVEGYMFTKWSDGNTDNPRTLIVTSNINLTAEYKKVVENETYYQYRGYIKDQLNMTDKPKSFVLAKNDKDGDDLLTKKTSTIEVQEIPTNVNEGDVIVLYTPKGTKYYQGVISKISDKKITCGQMASFFNGTFNKSYINHLTGHTTIESEIKAVLDHFISGVYYGSTYTDTLVNQRLNGFSTQYVGTQAIHLPTDKDDKGNDKNTSYNMEQFIYDMYNDYGVICEFEVNYEGANYLKVFTPDYDQITIGNNQNAITNISPITTIEQTNKLIIFNQDNTYRTTFVMRKDGEVVEEPSSVANRFEITNVKIVKSDDTNDILIKANLPSKPFNHKLTFTLLTDNNLYDWHDLKLGMPLHIFIDGVFFDSVLTAREIIHNENQNIKQINYTCGMVRIAITDILNNRFGRGN